jgi:leucyl aminopeptidase (aminopeptidase T)
MRPRSFVLLVAGVCVACAFASARPSGWDARRREALANQLVSENTRVHKGDLVQLAGCPADIGLLEDLAVAVRRQGGHPLITISSDGLLRRFYDDVPATFDSQPAAFDLKLAAIIDVRIQTEFNDDAALAGISAERVESVSRGQREVYALLRKRKVRLLWLGNGLYPTRSRARHAGLALPELESLFRAGLDADPRTLRTTGERVRKVLAAGKTVRITSASETDLTLEIGGRPITISDGILNETSEHGIAPPWTWLPAGEVYVVPVPGSANGKIVLDRYLFEGKEVHGLTLTVRAGKLVDLRVESGGEALQAAYKAAEAGKETVSSLDLGINPNVRLPKNSLLQTNVPAGMVTVAFGNNTWAGGDIKIPFTLPLYIADGTLTVDGAPLIERGAFKAR